MAKIFGLKYLERTDNKSGSAAILDRSFFTITSFDGKDFHQDTYHDGSISTL